MTFLLGQATRLADDIGSRLTLVHGNIRGQAFSLSKPVKYDRSKPKLSFPHEARLGCVALWNATPSFLDDTARLQTLEAQLRKSDAVAHKNLTYTRWFEFHSLRIQRKIAQTIQSMHKRDTPPL